MPVFCLNENCVHTVPYALPLVFISARMCVNVYLDPHCDCDWEHTEWRYAGRCSLSSHSSQLSLYLIKPSEPDTNCSLCSGNKYDHAFIGTTVRDREIERGREREGVGVCVCLAVSLCVLFTGSSVNSKFTITTRLSLKLKCLFFQCLNIFSDPSLISRNNYKTTIGTF